MVNNYDKHVELMTRNLKDLGLGVQQVSEATKDTVYKVKQPLNPVGKMFEDCWED